MTKTLTVEVAQEDITAGTKFACGFCPIALALQRATGFWLLVWRKTISLPQRDPATRKFKTAGELPNVAVNFIKDFDGGSPVKPFAFDVVLDLP